ncbi:MAG: histone deacetylase [Desulfotignum sp.]|nr:histone deacetylase [Desulfotignum sp.]
MIRYQDLAYAVANISRQDPEIGYALSELMAAGHIRIPLDAGNPGEDPCFLFEEERVFVRNVSFFNHGIAPLEERLVLKYGEAAEKHRIDGSPSPRDFFAAATRIHVVGISCLVNFELKSTVSRLKEKIRTAGSGTDIGNTLSARLETLQQLLKEPFAGSGMPLSLDEPLYFIELPQSDDCHFILFPFTSAALGQLAQLNLEFFHLRFVLDLFVSGASHRLFACVSQGKITGMIYLKEKKRLFYTGLEIHYVATVNGLPLDEQTLDYPRLRGTGTVLIAGTWLLWKSDFPGASEIVLDAEIGAERFYETIGFDFRPPYGYLLKHPKDKLLLYIVGMAMNCETLPDRLQAAVIQCIKRQIACLKKSIPADDPKRKVAILAISSCNQGNKNKALAAMVQDLVSRNSRRIPEAGMLLQVLAQDDADRSRHILVKGASMIWVVSDPVFDQHLEGIFHMESRKRTRALASILAKEPFSDRHIPVQPRAATEQELAWIHLPEHITKIAKTEGKKLTYLDPDTQTTPHSYAVARLAAGSVFSLIDAVYNDPLHRSGIACIRPPGHHAEPDRAMGFCLFNNVALGAAYLQHRYGAKRILIVDMDIHHGNGIQKAFYDSRKVLYFSAHQFPCYPGTGKLAEIGTGEGKGFTINVPLPKGREDRDYAAILHFLLTPVAEHFQPDMILVALGFDLYARDPLGQMNVTPDGYALITYMLKQLAKKVCSGRIIFVLEGGYSIQGIRECGLRVLQELVDLPTLSLEKIRGMTPEKPGSVPELKKAMDLHRAFWPSIP